MEGEVLCTTGGTTCLDEWIANNIPLEYTYTVDGTSTTYEVYEGTGKVVDSDGNVICTTGGKTCLEDHITSITPANYEVESGNMVFKFKGYTDGTITDNDGVSFALKEELTA